ncbi:sugar phosphate isomerase/epimerase [Arenibacter sp. F26102]|uniref:sugar phosphate isomerase/epimerase family protein n=1 Tax=Arenibacter sp. F26102 TaxID=2926416 RepID=UPI001FF558AD|nr:sugar phosphate isomerase/epimerase family protein [Arenibacter sp. F26102]MCK0148281.1 sugar phosphate isomerase/epimerase [Arenibacter sp. F26102]
MKTKTLSTTDSPKNIVPVGKGNQLGMHTDNWRTLSGPFEQAVASAIENKLNYLEFGLIDEQNFIQGLGYDPALPMDIDEMELKRSLDKRNIQVSQIDGGYPLTGPKGAVYGVPYLWKAIRMAHLIGCPFVDTTDGATKPKGWSDKQTIEQWRLNLRLVLERAESYGVGINIEPHGPFTNNLELMVQILEEFDSPWLGVNFDTANVFIAGHDPLTYLKTIRPWLRHVHCKDVPQAMAESSRGEETGIALSEVSIGQGANADNIAACINYLTETKWDGVFSIETLGTPQNIGDSTAWLRKVIASSQEKI